MSGGRSGQTPGRRSALAVVGVLALAALLSGAVSAPESDDPREARVVTAARTSAPVPVDRPAPRTDPDDLLPNARALPASRLVIRRSAEGERKLRFDSGLANVGPGPLEVRPAPDEPCPRGQQFSDQVVYQDANGDGVYDRDQDTEVRRRGAGCMVFHRAHDHWHFEAAARYSVRTPDAADPIVVTSRKMSFCLRDIERVPDRWATGEPQPETYGDCHRSTPQGISVGWVDVYQRDLAGQRVTLPPRTRDGTYCLRTDVDPRDQLVESDDTDNSSLTAFALRGDRVLPRPTSRCR